MRKILFIGLALLGFAAAQAQVSVKPGIRAGLNFSHFTNADDASFKTDFFVGGTMAIKFTKFYTLQPEISYSRQGSKVMRYYQNFDPVFDPSPSFLAPRSETTFSLDYLTVGIINKFTFKGFQMMIGPSLDFKVADNFAGNSTQRPIDFDLALVAGVGYAFPNGLGIDLRIKQGMVDVFVYDHYDTYNNEYNNDYRNEILNQVIQLGVFYSFDLK